MIITETPFRMSFFGGGTDMEDFFRAIVLEDRACDRCGTNSASGDSKCNEDAGHA